MLFLLYEVFLAQFPLCLLGVGELVVPLGGMLAVQVLCPHFMQGLQLLVLQLYGAGEVTLPHLLDGVFVCLDHVQFLGSREEKSNHFRVPNVTAISDP